MGCTAATQLPQPRAVREPSDEYDLTKTLGKGAFGIVKAARPRSNSLGSDGPCAIKVVDMTVESKTKGGTSRRRVSASQKKIALMELSMWQSVGRHPNVVVLIDAYVASGKMFLVMERCDCNLSQKLRRDHAFLDRDPTRVFREMLLGVQACHSVNIVHRDVKLENFLVGSSEDESSVKLCDFGLAARLPANGLLRGEYGTAPLMSPEMLNGEGYGLGTDVWSSGAAMYLALFKELPYLPMEDTPACAKAAVVRGDPPRWLSRSSRRESAAAFLRTLLERQPCKRCTAKQALMHPYLAEAQSSSLPGMDGVFVASLDS